MPFKIFHFRFLLIVVFSKGKQNHWFEIAKFQFQIPKFLCISDMNCLTFKWQATVVEFLKSTCFSDYSHGFLYRKSREISCWISLFFLNITRPILYNVFCHNSRLLIIFSKGLKITLQKNLFLPKTSYFVKKIGQRRIRIIHRWSSNKYDFCFKFLNPQGYSTKSIQHLIFRENETFPDPRFSSLTR